MFSKTHVIEHQSVSRISVLFTQLQSPENKSRQPGFLEKPKEPIAAYPHMNFIYPEFGKSLSRFNHSYPGKKLIESSRPFIDLHMLQRCMSTFRYLS